MKLPMKRDMKILITIAIMIIFIIDNIALANIASIEAKVAIKDRQILLNGNPFIVKGVGYSPVPIGTDPEAGEPYGDYYTYNFNKVYNRDLPLLRKIGANTIRLWGWNNSANHTDFLNKAYNKGNKPMYVIITFWMGKSVYPDLSDQYVRDKAKKDFRNMVKLHKNNSDILMWSIGNELNAPWMYGNNLTALFSLINEMAKEAHLEDKYHPVTTVLADVNSIDTIKRYNSSMTYLDIWSIDPPIDF